MHVAMINISKMFQKFLM